MRKLLALALLAPSLAFAGVTADQGMASPRQFAPWRVESSTPTTEMSSFGETETIEKTPILSLDFNYAINSYFVATTTANGGTVTQATSMAVLQTSTATNGSALLESKAAVRYIAGTGVFASFTALFTACAASSQQEVGLGDANDGFFIGCQNATFGIFLRKGGSDSFTARTAWSYDKLDGTGPSGLTLTTTNLTLFKVSFGWHGSGPVKFYIFDAPNGKWALFHVIGAGVTSPRILNPTLPLHAKAINSGNGTNLTVKMGSMGAYREGGPSPAPDSALAANGSATATQAVTTEENILTIRNNATVFSGQTNRVRVKLTRVTLTNTTAGAVVNFRGLLNTTLGGAPSFVDFDSTTSVVALDSTGTTVTGGRPEFHLTTVSGGSGIPSYYVDLDSLNIILNPGDTFTWTAATAGGAQTITVACEWLEFFSG